MPSIKLRPLLRKPALVDYTEIFSVFVIHYSRQPSGWKVRFQLRDLADIPEERRWDFAVPVWWASPPNDYQSMTLAREDVRRQYRAWRILRDEQKKKNDISE